MRTVKVNFNEAEVIPEGSYEVTVKKVKLKKSKTSSNKYLCWQMQIIDGAFSGTRLFLSTSLSKKALWQLKKLLRTINYPCQDSTTDLNLDELKDRKLKVRVEHETYLGKVYNAIVDFQPLTHLFS